MKNLKNYLETNPEKTIVDFLQTSEGVSMIEELNYAVKKYNQQPIQELEDISISVTPSRLFYYTGAVMLSSIVWGFIILILFIMLISGAGASLKDIIMHLLIGNIG